MDDRTSPSFIWGLFMRELFETSASIICYGLYGNLFIIAMYTLRRRRTSGRTWLLAASWVLFVVGTLQTVFRVLISTILAQAVALLVGRSRDEVSTAALVAILQQRLDLELACNAAFTVNVISAPPDCSVDIEVIAGRIWWMRKALASFTDLHSSINTSYNTTISIILESGSLYCFTAFLLAIALTTTGSSSHLYSVLLGVSTQAINIAPTLTVVRVGLGHNIEDAVKTGFSMPLSSMRTVSTARAPAAAWPQVFDVDSLTDK
ncbi:hypothetical protein C8R47DRAFT_1211428 [Mycena vitilis]|nr:hypothetical protein C8R47DRAFT_1211428 [Mycena vitilis]